MASSVTMSDAQFNRLRKIIYDRAGIWFADGKKYVLESRLARRLGELEIDNFDQYTALLSMGPYQVEEFQQMFNRITINETSFFRNEPQLRVFETVVLPELLKLRASRKQLRIWSAGCSSGEEPYTLAILLHRSLGIRLGDWKIEVLGTDISEYVLNQAAAGTYSDYAIRATPQLVVQRYFKKEGSSYQIDPEVAKLVRFEKLNFKDKLAARRLGTWDVIFCRNVMIYFDQEMRQGLMTMFHEMLEPDGTFFIGHSETLRDNPSFAGRSEAHAFAYNPVRKGVKNVA